MIHLLSSAPRPDLVTTKHISKAQYVLAYLISMRCPYMMLVSIIRDPDPPSSYVSSAQSICLRSRASPGAAYEMKIISHLKTYSV